MPDLALADFSLFLKVELALKGGYFSNISHMQRCVTKPVKGVSLQDFPRGLQDLYKQSHHRVKLGGEFIYFFVINAASLCTRYTVNTSKSMDAS